MPAPRLGQALLRGAGPPAPPPSGLARPPLRALLGRLGRASQLKLINRASSGFSPPGGCVTTVDNGAAWAGAFSAAASSTATFAVASAACCILPNEAYNFSSERQLTASASASAAAFAEATFCSAVAFRAAASAGF